MCRVHYGDIKCWKHYLQDLLWGIKFIIFTGFKLDFHIALTQVNCS